MVLQFIPNDQIGKDRCSFFNLHNNTGKQGINDLNPEYDLLQYPLLFPDGGDLRMGWTEKMKKVLDPWTTVWSVYSRLCEQRDLSFENDLSIHDMVKKINELLNPSSPITVEHFGFDNYYDSKRPHVISFFFISTSQVYDLR